MRKVDHPKFLSINPILFGVGLEDIAVGVCVMIACMIFNLGSTSQLFLIVLTIITSKFLRTYVDVTALLLPKVDIGGNDE